MALLASRIGVEIGQLIFVASLLLRDVLLDRILRSIAIRLAPVPSYAIGIAGGYWCIERFALGWDTGFQ